MTISNAENVELLNDREQAQKLKITLRKMRTLRNPNQADPLPSIRIGKSYRYLWGSPEMNAWLARRANRRSSKRTQ